MTGKYYLKKWGTTTDHAMTIVGYDDRIEFDINGNGIYGEASADERGAWILVNSWGKEWGNDGLFTCHTLMQVPLLMQMEILREIGGLPKYTAYARTIVRCERLR